MDNHDPSTIQLVLTSLFLLYSAMGYFAVQYNYHQKIKKQLTHN
jgi:hypothetical protein